MPVGFGATTFDGTLLKQFTVTALDNDAAIDLVVAFDGVAGRPNPVPAVLVSPAANPLIHAGIVRSSAAASAASEWGIHTITRTGCTVRKLTAAGAGAAEVVTVTVDFRHSMGR
jgi:hypothetical protein